MTIKLLSSTSRYLVYMFNIYIFAGEKPDDKVYYILVSIPVLFFLVGMIYMCHKICIPAIREKCCCCCRCCSIDMEKKDDNLDYGEYRQACSSHYLIVFLLIIICQTHRKTCASETVMLSRWVLRSRWPRKETRCDGGEFRFPSSINWSMSVHLHGSNEFVTLE